MAASIDVGAPALDVASQHRDEYLTFSLGAEEYGIDILKVQEIRGYEKPTRIAFAPPFIKGVINLRGAIVPIIDLRIKLALGSADYTPFTVTIIVNTGGRIAGVVVDGVSDVARIGAEALKAAPECSAAAAPFIDGLACLEDRMIILTDIEKLLSSAELDRAAEPLAA